MAPGARNHASRNAPAHGTVVWLSIGVIVLIAYGSLYPFGLKPHAAGQSMWQALGQLSWARAGRVDRISNVLLYVPLGICVFLSLDGRVRRATAAILATVVGTLLSLAIEVAQVFISSRVPSLWDVTFNACGAASGVVGGIAWRILSGRLLAVEAGAGRSDVGAMIGLLFWFCWRWAPFAPHVDLAALKAALQPLIVPQLQAAQCAHYLLWWVVVAEMVFAAVNRTRGTESLLTVIAVTLVGRLFFVDSPLIASELLALLLLLPLLVGLHKVRATARQTLLLVLFVANYLWLELSSWYNVPSVAHGGFDFWPFMSWIQAGMPIDAVWLSRRLFLATAAVWLLRNAGVGARATIYWVSGVALAMACLQSWLAHRGGSITEPALAFGVAWSLRLIDERFAPGASLRYARNR